MEVFDLLADEELDSSDFENHECRRKPARLSPTQLVSSTLAIRKQAYRCTKCGLLKKGHACKGPKRPIVHIASLSPSRNAANALVELQNAAFQLGWFDTAIHGLDMLDEFLRSENCTFTPTQTAANRLERCKKTLVDLKTVYRKQLEQE